MLDIARTGPASPSSTGSGVRELRLAVLPFGVDGDDGDDRLFRDIAEEVTYGRARYRTLAVISPYSALGLSPDGPREVHADYVVRGRVRRARDGRAARTPNCGRGAPQRRRSNFGFEAISQGS